MSQPYRHVGLEPWRGCIGCRHCRRHGGHIVKAKHEKGKERREPLTFRCDKASRVVSLVAKPTCWEAVNDE